MKESPTVHQLFIELMLYAASTEGRARGFEEPRREVRFHPERNWRFDIALGRKVAVEIEGGLFLGQGRGRGRSGKGVGGRHNRAASMREDMVKYAEAAAHGWVVVRVMPEHVKQGHAVNWVLRAWEQRGVLP